MDFENGLEGVGFSEVEKFLLKVGIAADSTDSPEELKELIETLTEAVRMQGQLVEKSEEIIFLKDKLVSILKEQIVFLKSSVA